MTQTSQYRWIKRKSIKLLTSRGYQFVHPSDSFLSQYARLSFIGMRGDYEALCVKVNVSDLPFNEIRSIEGLCWKEIAQFNNLLTMYPGDMFLRCEVWIFAPYRELYCFEVAKDGIREAVYA